MTEKVYRIGYVLRVYPSSTIIAGTTMPSRIKLAQILKNNYESARSAYTQIGIRMKKGKFDQRNTRIYNENGEYEVYEWSVLEYDEEKQEYTVLGRNLTRTSHKFPLHMVI